MAPMKVRPVSMQFAKSGIKKGVVLPKGQMKGIPKGKVYQTRSLPIIPTELVPEANSQPKGSQSRAKYPLPLPPLKQPVPKRSNAGPESPRKRAKTPPARKVVHPTPNSVQSQQPPTLQTRKSAGNLQVDSDQILPQQPTYNV